MNFRKKLSTQTGASLQKGLKKAAIKVLGYDQKASRAVQEYFGLLSARYDIPEGQIRIEIRPGKASPQITLFLCGRLEREITSEHLIHIFGGNAARMIPGLSEIAQNRVRAFLSQWAEKLQVGREECFFRLMVIAASPVLMVGAGERVIKEISVTDVVLFFS